MLVRQLMTASPITLTPDATLEHALDRMVRYEIHEIHVVEDDAVVGIVTDRDLKMLLGPGTRRIDPDLLDPTALNLDVSFAMTPEVETIRADAPLSLAARMLLELRVGALPVEDENGKLVGILSVTDLLRWSLQVFEAAEG